MTRFGKLNLDSVRFMARISNEAAVYAALLLEAMGKDEAAPGTARLAELTGLTTKAVERALGQLRKRGLKATRATGNAVVSYCVTPPHMEAPENGGVTPPNTGTSPPQIPGPQAPENGGVEGALSSRGIDVDTSRVRAYARKKNQEKNQDKTREDLLSPSVTTPAPDQTQEPEKTPPVQEAPPAPRLVLESQDGDAPARLFALWCEITGRARAKLDDKRKAILRRAVKAYGLTECELAIRGLGLSDWHMGRDPKTNGKRYDSLELVFRSAEKTERFIELAREEEPKEHEQLSQRDLDDAWDRYVVEFHTAARDKAPSNPPPDMPGLHHGARPTGSFDLFGETVAVFDDAQLTLWYQNLCAARHAEKRLVKAYGSHPQAVELAATYVRQMRTDLMRIYRDLEKRLQMMDHPESTEGRHAH